MASLGFLITFSVLSGAQTIGSGSLTPATGPSPARRTRGAGAKQGRGRQIFRKWGGAWRGNGGQHVPLPGDGRHPPSLTVRRSFDYSAPAAGNSKQASP